MNKAKRLQTPSETYFVLGLMLRVRHWTPLPIYLICRSFYLRDKKMEGNTEQKELDYYYSNLITTVYCVILSCKVTFIFSANKLALEAWSLSQKWSGSLTLLVGGIRKKLLFA